MTSWSASRASRTTIWALASSSNVGTLHGTSLGRTEVDRELVGLPPRRPRRAVGEQRQSTASGSRRDRRAAVLVGELLRVRGDARVVLVRVAGAPVVEALVAIDQVGADALQPRHEQLA